jgi:hypothetical protein
MVRNLLWLENPTFAACGWIMPSRPPIAAKASAPVRATFAEHDCEKFPRHVSSKEKRPSRGMSPRAG